MTQSEIQKILINHKDWLNNNKTGEYVSLQYANLQYANLQYADLRGADLQYADLQYADLRGADLRGADLRGADLLDANLLDANLLDAKYDKNSLWYAQTRILPEGDIIGYKKCSNNVIVKLLIPKDAERSHSFGRKCRASKAIVLEFSKNVDFCYSAHDQLFIYRIGETVVPIQKISNESESECESGIHFFITKEEAINY
jgi:hypothetical protein